MSVLYFYVRMEELSNINSLHYHNVNKNAEFVCYPWNELDLKITEHF